MKKTDEERFLARVDMVSAPNGCWIWIGSKNQDGYGRFRLNGRDVQATHAALILIDGTDIPSGMEVMHACDNPPCVRNDHLSVGTRADNMADKVAKGRQARGNGHGARTKPESRPRGEVVAQHGERHGMAKLADSDIPMIRMLCASGRRYESVATEFGVSRATISMIATRRTWKHIP